MKRRQKHPPASSDTPPPQRRQEQLIFPLRELELHAYQLFPGRPLGPDFARGLVPEEEQENHYDLIKSRPIKDYYARQALIIMSILRQVSVTQEKLVGEFLGTLYLPQRHLVRPLDERPDFDEFAMYYIHNNNQHGLQSLLRDPDVFANPSVRRTFEGDRFFDLAILAGRHASASMVVLLLNTFARARPYFTRKLKINERIATFFKTAVQVSWMYARFDVANNILLQWRQWPWQSKLAWKPHLIPEDTEDYARMIEMHRTACSALTASKSQVVYATLRDRGFLPDSLEQLSRTNTGIFSLDCYLTDANRLTSRDLRHPDVTKWIGEVLTYSLTQQTAALIEKHYDVVVEAIATFNRTRPVPITTSRDFFQKLVTSLVLDVHMLPVLLRLLRTLFPESNPLQEYPENWVEVARHTGAVHLLPTVGLNVTPQIAAAAMALPASQKQVGLLTMRTILQELRFARQHHLPWATELNDLLQRLSSKALPTRAEWEEYKAVQPATLDWYFLTKFLVTVDHTADRGMVVEWLDLFHAAAPAELEPDDTLRILSALYEAGVRDPLLGRFMDDIETFDQVESFYDDPSGFMYVVGHDFARPVLNDVFARLPPSAEHIQGWIDEARSDLEDSAGPQQRSILIYFLQLQRERFPSDEMDTQHAMAPRIPGTAHRRIVHS